MLGSAAIGASTLLAPSVLANTLSGSTGEDGGLAREGSIPADEASRIAKYRRMRMRCDDGLIYWIFHGRNYAQQGATLIPFCELN